VAFLEARGLQRTFVLRPRRRGVLGAVRDLFGGERTVVRALDGVDLEVEPGQTVGLLGPNGAGKSTTVKCLAGILEPTGGTVRVAGRDPFRERQAHVREIGVLFGQRTQLWWDLAVQEAFDLLLAVYGVPEAAGRERLARLDALLGIGAFMRVPVRELSLGQRVRCDLAAALLHGPRLLLLDEPTIGLDVTTRLRVRAFLRDLAAREGVAVLLTSHDLADVEQVCERVVVIDHGKVAFDGDLSAMRARVGLGRVVLVEAGRPVADADLAVVGAAVPGRVVRRSETAFAVHLGAGEGAGAAVAAVVSRGPVADLHVQEPSTEEVVAALWERGR